MEFHLKHTFVKWIVYSIGTYLVINYKYLYITSGFWPRLHARALRALVLLGTLTRQTGRCECPSAHRSFAASYAFLKNFN
jgi:hypothetical protein